MKNLRHLLSRSGLISAQPRQRRPENRRSDVSRRRLSNEALERRELLAGDILASNHNYWHPYDVNDDGQNTARDALAIINYMSRDGYASGELAAAEESLDMYYDVNADHRISAADALSVINAISRGEAAGELAELMLTVRTDDDLPITPDGDGDINVEVGEIFELEVSYEDLRRFGTGIGAFQLFTDITTSQADVLEPILSETQRLAVGAEFIFAILDGQSGNLTFSIEGSTDTYVSSGDDFADDDRQEVINALSTFGYTLGTDYTLRQLDFGPREDLPFLPAPPFPENSRASDIGYEIHWDNDKFGDQDLPDITITPSGFTDSIPTSTTEFAPRNPDGSINSDAVRFNIDTRSRTFNNNEPFYATNNRGNFDAAVGFTDVGGIGPIPSNGGGIPNLTDDGSFIEPFDAYSLRVRITSPVTDFQVSALPGQDLEALLLYGRDDPVPQDLILVDGDNVVTINATAANQDPVVTAPVTATFNEDQGQQTVNLLDNASDPDGDALSITTPTITGDQSGISVSGSTVTVTPGAYGDLNDGQNAVISFTYNVVDGNGGSTAQTATITITGITDVVNQPPVVTAPVTATFNEDQGQQTVNLLDNASDPDGDALSITTPVINGDQSGISVSGNTVTVTPGAYGDLNDGQNAEITFTYNVTDGNGGSTAQTATITITGITDNNPPVVSAPVTATFNEDQGQQTVNLLDNASDPDGDTLNITTPVINGDQSGISVSGSTVTVTPGAYDALNDGQNAVITFTYDVTDGNGGSTAQTATITITGITDNNPPVVSAPVTATFNEDQGQQTVNLLDNASDPDGDSLDITTPVINGNQAGISVNGSTVTVTPGAYGDLNDGQNSVITFSYNVTDGNGGSTAQTATITITGITDIVNQAPVVSAPVTATFNEDQGQQTVNLLDNATDPDGDPLSITTPVITGDQSGISVNGNIVTVTPNAYDDLNDGENAVVTFSYNVTDGDLSTAQTATITITGITENVAPVVSAPVTATFNEDQGQQTVNLLDNASDANGDPLSITTPTINGDQSGISVNGNIVTVTPGAYDALNDGQNAVITFTYDVTDGELSTPQTATITITGITDNRAPTVGDPVTATFSEQDASATVDLLTGASDLDGDTLNVSGLTVTGGNAGGISQSGNNLSVNPDFYGFLGDNESEVITYTYNVTDGDLSTAQSATITINGFNDPPRARDDNNVIAFVDITQDIDVLANDDAGVGEEGQALTIVSATSDDGNATVTPNNGMVAFTPDPGFTGATSFTYTIEDAGGKQSTATVNVTVQDFNPSTITGSIFIDHIENLTAVINEDATPFRDGLKDADESGVGGVMVQLHSAAADNVSGQVVDLVTYTSLDGEYSFEGIAPGNYSVTPLIDGITLDDSSQVLYLGPSHLDVGIAVEGGQVEDQLNFPLLGTGGNALNTVDILASSYLRTNPSEGDSNGGRREGGIAYLDESGEQEMFIALAGFEGIVFAEVTLNEARDSALLSVVEEDGDVLTAVLDQDDFVVSNGDGFGVQFFGGIDDFDFVSADSAFSDEFDDYLDKINAFRN